jgi:predicted AAA+ superfamily ATPase
MAFLSGPRQCGKTTLAKQILNKHPLGVYYNWDEAKFRRTWAKDPNKSLPEAVKNKKPLLIFDELDLV